MGPFRRLLIESISLLFHLSSLSLSLRGFYKVTEDIDSNDVNAAKDLETI